MENTGIMAVLEREVRKFIILPKDSYLNVREVSISNGKLSASVHFVIGAGVEVERFPGAEPKKEIPGVDIDNVHEQEKPKRKYTRRNGQKAMTVTKPRAIGGSIDLDNLKKMKKDLYNWDSLGHLDENQVKAWVALSGVNIRVMSDIQKTQLKGIWEATRGKVKGQL